MEDLFHPEDFEHLVGPPDRVEGLFNRGFGVSNLTGCRNRDENENQ
jgi:hypothetical protein